MRQTFAADGNGEVTTERSLTVPAVAVTAPGTTQPAAAVVPESVATQMGFTATTTALLVDGVDITTDKQDALDEALEQLRRHGLPRRRAGLSTTTPSAVTLLVLGCVGGVLVLGGTLTATFLALSDARPDFATMGAVGAAPRTRRAVAASYAATIGLVGAALGATVGFIPGIAVTYPLTSASWAVGSVDAAGVPIAEPLPRHPVAVDRRPGGRPAAADRCHRRSDDALTTADGQPAVVTSRLWTPAHQTRRQSGVSESTTSTGTVLAQASISRNGRMPTDS